MPQLQLPMFPASLTPITEDIGFQCRDERAVYFHGHLPTFQHAKEDLKSFRLYTSQLIDSGVVRQADIVKAFDVPLATVKRYMRVYREQGAEGFFRQQRRRSASVVNGEVQRQVQELLDAGMKVPEVARKMELLPNTLHKAIRAGRRRGNKKKT